MAYTRAEFRDIIRQRLGWPTTDNFVADTEINNYLKDSARELWALLSTIRRAGSWGYTEAAITTVPGQSAYALPADFGRLIAVRLLYSNTLVPLKRRDAVTDVQRVLLPQSWTPGNVTFNLSGIFSGDYILQFDPPPSGAFTFDVAYIVAAPLFPSDTDVSWMNEDEYLIIDVMIKLLQKEESDVSALVAQKAMFRQRLELEAVEFDSGEAPTVADVRRGDYDTREHWFFRRY